VTPTPVTVTPTITRVPPPTSPAEASCFDENSPLNPDLPAPTFQLSDLTNVVYYPAYHRVVFAIRLSQSSTATCVKGSVLDNAGNPSYPIGLTADGTDVPLREGTSTTWTIRYYQGNPQGRSPWSNGLVIQIPVPPPGLFGTSDNTGLFPPELFQTTWCNGVQDSGENAVCDITSLVSVSTVP